MTQQIAVTEKPPETKHVAHNVTKGKMDLRKLDGHASRQVDAKTGAVVERKFKVLWDQRKPITKKDLTKSHKLVKVVEDEFEVRKEKVVVTEETINRKKVVPQKRVVEMVKNK